MIGGGRRCAGLLALASLCGLLACAPAARPAGSSPGAPPDGPTGDARRARQWLASFTAIHGLHGVVSVQVDGQAFLEVSGGALHRRGDRFFIGSLTKQFTAAVVLDLVDRGRLDLERTVGDYLPEHRTAPAGQLTLHQLLSNSSGIAVHPLGEGSRKALLGPATREQVLKEFVAEPLRFAPARASSTATPASSSSASSPSASRARPSTGSSPTGCSPGRA